MHNVQYSSDDSGVVLTSHCHVNASARCARTLMISALSDVARVMYCTVQYTTPHQHESRLTHQKRL